MQVIDGGFPETLEDKVDIEQVASTKPDAWSRPKSRRLPWIAAVVLGSLVVLGAGIGVGYGAHTRSSVLRTKPTSTPPVTSGTTGITAFSCNVTGQNTYETSDGTKFREECYTAYKGGTLNSDLNANISNAGHLTVYSFESCMDSCAEFNRRFMGSSSCQAVSYNADLTFAIPRYGDNCWLKDMRGERYWGEPEENYGLVASAYIVSS